MIENDRDLIINKEDDRNSHVNLGSRKNSSIIKAFKSNPDLSISVRDLGLRFFQNPNHQFSLKGLYRSFFERKLIKESQVKAGKSLYRWIWRDLNFDVKSGDVIAIMGANGEGKTTLLRVLSGLLAADEGLVASRYKPFLLSAGLGFREELSGYENIKLGGLFLNMSPGEIKELIPSIRDFSELSHDDLLKPFKYYSDGMKARLVFSVATATVRQILFLDEILGAGDIGFQKKAAKRMEKLMADASTIVIVSHNIDFVKRSASKGILLHGGKIQEIGPAQDIVKLYEKFCI